MKKNTVNEKNTPNYLLYFVVIVFALMAFATVATIKQNHAKAASSIEPGNCKYYDMYAEAGGPETIGKIDLKEPTELVEKLEANASATPADLDATVLEIKSKIRDKYGEYNALNWDRFDGATVKLTDYQNGRYEALYYEQTNTLYIFKTAAQGDKYYETIAHELIHALTMTASNKKSFYYEGFTEYLAQQVYNTNSASYVHTFVFAEAYCNKYGLEQTINDFMADTARLDIDKQLNRPGMSDALEALAYMTDSQMKLDAYPMAILTEAYCHYCRALGIEIPKESRQWLIMLLKTAGAASEDITYLKNI